MLTTPSGSAHDCGFENTVEIVRGPTYRFVRKRFQRKERFRAEFIATTLAAEFDVAPPVLFADQEKLVIIRVWRRGAPLKIWASDEVSASAALVALANCLRALHQRTSMTWGPVGASESASWHDYLCERMTLRLTQASGLGPDERAWLRRWAMSRLEQLIAPERASLLHHDLKPKNILHHSGAVCLIDFEQAKWGDPLSDLAKLKWRTLRMNAALWQAFGALYFQGRPSDPRRDAAVEFYLAMHCLGALAYDPVYNQGAFRAHAASALSILKGLRETSS